MSAASGLLQPLATRVHARAQCAAIERARGSGASIARASHGDANDTRGIIAELAQLRTQQAALLGYPNYAGYALYDQMARTPEVTE